MSVKPITKAVPMMTAARMIAMLTFPFLISFHPSMGVIHKKIFTRMPKEIAIEIAPESAQPKVIKYWRSRGERSESSMWRWYSQGNRLSTDLLSRFCPY